LAMDPRNLLKFIEESPDALPKEKRDRLIDELRAAEEETCSIERVYEERFGKYEANELSGYKKLDLAKLFNAICISVEGESQCLAALEILLKRSKEFDTKQLKALSTYQTKKPILFKNRLYITRFHFWTNPLSEDDCNLSII